MVISALIVGSDFTNPSYAALSRDIGGSYCGVGPDEAFDLVDGAEKPA